MNVEEWGGVAFRWAEDNPSGKGTTTWSPFKDDTSYFAPSSASFMINYRIDNMDEMLAQLKQNGVEILKGPDTDFNGKFAWVLDPDGNKVELWEPMAATDAPA